MRHQFSNIMIWAGALFIGAAVAIMVAMPVAAQASAGTQGQGRDFIRQMAAYCPGAWEDQNCLAAVSQSTYYLSAFYMEDLHESGQRDAADHVRDHCAAATAAMKDEFPADAMRSAYTDCANIIADVTEQTGISPDRSHYQLLIIPVLCLSGDPRCAGLEEQLRAYRR